MGIQTEMKVDCNNKKYISLLKIFKGMNCKVSGRHTFHEARLHVACIIFRVKSTRFYI